ncbi:related to FAD-dependent oxidoreductase [Lecanosticta acicola]|uniref:Related to FAD-dependent oxidoreductase n=1 Tax=Lecanosticta acicola TaxID=111012 RepID=A0AAI8Z2P8_9PEZI|nr:related to FAD-dependent oxidoreductase [Lecanosticta acicola]
MVTQPRNGAPIIKEITPRPHSEDGPTVLIVGAGTFGTSTAYHLAKTYKDPSKVTVVDRAPSPPKPAAAIDINRVIRTDYPSPLYCNLAHEAIHPWFWTQELGPFFHKVGWLYLNEDGSDISERIKTTFEGRGSNCAEDVPLRQLETRWKGVLKDTEKQGFNEAYFNPELSAPKAGWVNASGATARFMEAAVKMGVKRVTSEVREILLDITGSRVKGVRTADGDALTADKVVLATGAWTSSLLAPVEDALNIPEQDRIERQAKATGTVSAYYSVNDEEIDQLECAETPVVVYGGNGEVFPPSKGNRLMKFSNSKTTFTNTVTTDSGHKISVPLQDQSYVPESLKRQTKEIMADKVLPTFAKNKKPDFWRVCYDAQTPTEDFLMCKHPHAKLGNLYLITGGSFHSYKFMPIIGKYMLNVLKGESNGPEKDQAWAWKQNVNWTDVREFGLLSGKAVAKRELKDLESPLAKL